MFEHLSPAYNYGALMRKITQESLEASFEGLSFVERDNINRDIYGLKEPVDESDDFVEKKLKELETELGLLSKRSKAAYNSAISLEMQRVGGQQEKYYVRSRKFLVMFLRADEFDAKMAARRITRHFKEKQKLFGYEKLASKIKQEDLNEDDKVALRSGYFCITGATDKHGRFIVLCNRDRIGNQKIINLQRAIFYLTQGAMEDSEQSQRKGVIAVRFSFGGQDENTRSYIRTLSLLGCPRIFFRALPVRLACVHNCYNDLDAENTWIRPIISVTPQLTRAKFLWHGGTPTECMRQLREYGIDNYVLPVTKDGELRDEIITKNLETRRWLEEEFRQHFQHDECADSEDFTEDFSRSLEVRSEEESKLLGLRVDCFYLSDESSVSELSFDRSERNE